MKRILLRILVGAAALVLVLVVGLVAAVLLLQGRRFDAPYPEIGGARSEASVIERGRYLVYGPAHCANCHGDPRREGALDAPLSGGLEFVLPIGTLRAPNLTPDAETGIGRYRDEEIARALRHGVGRDGRALFPFMASQHMSDEDMVAVISYLRAQPPVRHPVEVWSPTLLGRAVRAFFIKPVGPTHPAPARVTPDASVAYGEYLANSIANCVGCHTNRDLGTGAFLGPRFAGGLVMDSAIPGQKIVSPNLTPDPKTGWIRAWSEDHFVARFKSGTGRPGTHMPWKAYSRMGDDDLRAIFRYLRSLPPVENDVGLPLTQL